MGATAFTHPLAKRIVASNAWVEQQRGIEGGNEEAPYSLQSGSMLIRTGTTLPDGYTGAMAVLGEIVERTFSGEYLPRMPIWIRDINGGTLSANTVYQGVSGGSFTQDVTANGVVTPTTYGLYVVQAGNFSKITVRPNRWAYLEGKNKAGVKFYLRAVVWTDPGFDPDYYDVPVYVDSSMFTLKGTIEPYATKEISDGSYAASSERNNCFCNMYLNKTLGSYTWADIEKIPALISGEMGQPFFEFYPNDLTEIPYYFFTPTSAIADRDYPKDFVFTRRNLSDSNGQKTTIVKYINRNLAKQIGNFMGDGWSFNEKITTYTENQYGYNPLSGTSYIEKTILAGTNVYSDKTITLQVPDVFGLGYLKTKPAKYLFGPINYSDKVGYYPIQVLHANSPLYPIKPPTTGGISTGIGTGISGV